MAIKIQIRRGTAAQWTTANTVLADGEMGYEKDTGYLKFGNGVTAWNSLPYFGGSAAPSSSVLLSPRNEFAYNSGGGLLANVAAGKRVLGVDVYIEEGWDVASGQVRVGTASTPGMFITVAGQDLMAPSIHSIRTFDKFLVNTDVITTVTPGAGATAGQVFVVLTLEP